MTSHLKLINETQEYPGLINPFVNALREKDAHIFDLELQLRHQLTVSAGLTKEVDSLRKDLTSLRKADRELRDGVVELKAEYARKRKELEAENSIFKERIEGMGKDNEILKEKVAGLERGMVDREVENQEQKGTISSLEKKKDDLSRELVEWKDIKEQWRDRDLEVQQLRQEKETLRQEMLALKMEKDEASGWEESLRGTLKVLEAAKQELDERCAKHVDAIERKEREIDNLTSYIQKIKADREDLCDVVARRETERDEMRKERENLKRRLCSLVEELDGEQEEPSAKRPKSPDSGRSDRSPEGMRRTQCALSPDTPRKPSISSPGELRRLSGDQVCMIMLAHRLLCLPRL
jgi:chromosome segregation ATPase